MYDCLIFFRWGPPLRILSDQGREFCTEVCFLIEYYIEIIKHYLVFQICLTVCKPFWNYIKTTLFIFSALINNNLVITSFVFGKVNSELCRAYGIKRSVTSAYHPQTNGLTERMNHTFKERISKLCNEDGNDWDKYIKEVANSLRTQKQWSTGFTPYRLMFNCEHKAIDQVIIVFLWLRSGCWWSTHMSLGRGCLQLMPNLRRHFSQCLERHFGISCNFVVFLQTLLFYWLGFTMGLKVKCSWDVFIWVKK